MKIYISCPKAIMFQGTSSNAGKSLLAAGMCRLLARKGINVAPFKAQNMSLNSYVTMRGEELGRAQALQAQACGHEPDARMNPVLLKPLGNSRSQVIVLGQPEGMMTYKEYTARKDLIWEKVKDAYASLAAEYDIIVLEGAGSPAEINLRANDIVNMHMAHEAGARVMLVSDIDRGGAFAGIAGTMLLLDENDRNLIHGFILNRFRGDASLLRTAMEKVSGITGKPFLGIMPMLENLKLPDEDSVSFKEWASPAAPNGNEKSFLDVVVIDLPAISNFTDIDAFRLEPGVRIRKVCRGSDLGEPDLVILPGSRNSMSDLKFLRSANLFEGLKAYAYRIEAEGKGNIVGICGGLQMMGESLHDPYGIEGGGSEPCLGLLEIESVLMAGKKLSRVSGWSMLPACEHEVRGYEIHHGMSRQVGKISMAIRCMDGSPLGWSNAETGKWPRIWGTYMHGIFDSDAFRHAFLEVLRRDAGLPLQKGAEYNVDRQLDRLADVMSEHIDIERLLAP